MTDSTLKARAERTDAEILQDARIAVARGAGLLDGRALGWRDQIDLDAFDVESPAECILGQLCGGCYAYKTGLDSLDLPNDPYIAARYGFDTLEMDQRAGYAALQRAWLEELQANTGD